MKSILKQFTRSCLFQIILVVILIVTVRMASLPFGNDQYGYDYGFYAYAVKHTPLDSLSYFLGQVNDYGNHLFMVINWLRLPQLLTLEVLFIFFTAAAGVLLYLNLKNYSALARWTGILLFTLSIPQTLSYSMFLWKAAYGQVLLLLIFLLLQGGKMAWEIIPLLGLLITHKTTSFLALASLLPHYLLTKPKYKYWLVIGTCLLTAGFLYFLNGYSYLKVLAESDLRDGIFMDLKQYLVYSWYLVPLSAWGVYQSWKNKQNIPWIAMLLIGSAIVITRTIFHQRVIFFVDLSLIFFSALSIHYLRARLFNQLAVVTVVCAVAVVSLITYAKTIEPAIAEQEIHEIHRFAMANPGAFVLALGSQDAPWLLANLSGDIRLAAPGLFEDHLSKADWQNFWNNPQDRQFLNRFPKPLYIYTKSANFYPEGWECLEQSSTNFYKYVCN